MGPNGELPDSVLHWSVQALNCLSLISKSFLAASPKYGQHEHFMWEGKPPYSVLVLQVELSGGLKSAGHMLNKSSNKTAVTFTRLLMMATYTICLTGIPLLLVSGMHNIHK